MSALKTAPKSVVAPIVNPDVNNVTDNNLSVNLNDAFHQNDVDLSVSDVNPIVDSDVDSDVNPIVDLSVSDVQDLGVNFDLPTNWKEDQPMPKAPEKADPVILDKNDYRRALRGFKLKATLNLFSIGKDQMVSIDQNGNLMLNGLSARVALNFVNGEFTVHTSKILATDSAATKAAQRKVSTSIKQLTKKPISNLLSIGGESLNNAIDLTLFNPALFILFTMAEVIKLNPTFKFEVAFELACLEVENQIRAIKVRDSDTELFDQVKNFTVPRIVTDLFSSNGLDFSPIHALFSSGNDSRSGAYAVLLPPVND
jgi:hypothetical protein